MSDEVAAFFGLIIIVVIAVALIKGAIKTFQRNWIAALLLLILLTPIWLIWAFIEVFTGDVKAAAAQQPSSNTQSVNVTLVNHPDGTTRRLDGVQADDLKIIESSVLGDGAQISAPAPILPNDDTKECPFCAETIKRNAVVCRYCGRDI